MRFLKKISDTEYAINVFVKPNSKKQKIQLSTETIQFYLKSKPIKNKANKELLKMIKNALNLGTHQIKILFGAKSKDKTIKIQFSENINQGKIIEAFKKFSERLN